MAEFVPNKIVKAGEVIFKEGDYPDDGIFYICYGEVGVSRLEMGVERELASLGEGDVFGEMAIINTAPRNATVTAKTDCGFYTLSQERFQHQLHQLDPVMRGAFRVFVMTIRDLLSQRDTMTGQLMAVMQQMQQMPVPGMGYNEANQQGALLSDGATRKLHY